MPFFDQTLEAAAKLLPVSPPGFFCDRTRKTQRNLQRFPNFWDKNICFSDEHTCEPRQGVHLSDNHELQPDRLPNTFRHNQKQVGPSSPRKLSIEDIFFQ